MIEVELNEWFMLEFEWELKAVAAAVVDVSISYN